MYLKYTKNGNKATGQPAIAIREKNFKLCLNRPNIVTPLRIIAYMDSSHVYHLLITNLLKFEINIVKIIMKTKNRITYNPNFGKKKCEYCLLKTLQNKKSLLFQID